MTKLSSRLTAALVLLASGCELRPPVPPSAPPPATAEAPVDKPEPAVPLAEAVYLLGGTGVFDLASLKGQVVVLEVCAGWSSASLARVEELNQLNGEWTGQGLALVGLVVDGALSGAEGELKTSYPLVKVSPTYLAGLGKVRAVPSCRVYDRKGKERQVYDGHVSVSQLRADVAALLKE